MKMKNFDKNTIVCYKDNSCRAHEQEQALVIEEPLAIRVEGQPYAVVMRTPGNEIAHAAGFCLAEGLVDHPDDFATIGYCTEQDTNVVTATLNTERREKVENLLERRGFVSQTSCGICGKELIKDLYQILTPNTDNTRITVDDAFAFADSLSENQHLYKKTHASHAVMVYNSKLELMSVGEDVGRHNALDKAIGEVFMAGNMVAANIGVLSSRISYELVQKAARVKLAVLVGMSRPTELAVQLGESMNMTLASVRKNRLLIFCGKKRFGI